MHQITLQPKLRIHQNDWGMYHNLALEATENLWADTISDEGDSILLNMVRDMRGSDEDLASINDDDARKMMVSAKFQDMLSHAQDQGFAATTYWRSVLLNLLTEGKISQTLYDAFYPVFDASLTNEKMLEAMNSIPTTGLNTLDIQYLTVAKSVMNYSNNYWEKWRNENPNTPRAKRLSNGQKALAIDSIAAMGFFETGPFGVFIVAACSSAFTD
ncbi:MAG: hypothetical protein JSS78_03640 [Bacteroidetes bacterium]|nr:hypothetical protein [Bacteroidota bacterium]